ncbi:MAG: DUF2281 domain-containing protein [Prosthecobacter sp.]
MATPEQIYELVKAMPADQIDQVWGFVEFLQHKTQVEAGPRSIPPGTLTGLRGFAKRAQTPTDEELREEYTDYLTQKYQA